MTLSLTHYSLSLTTRTHAHTRTKLHTDLNKWGRDLKAAALEWVVHAEKQREKGGENTAGGKKERKKTNL